MFTGSIYFKYTPNGYVVEDAIKGMWWKKSKVCKSWRSIKIMCIEGTFNFTPVKGQFCKRPHKLIQWSKS